MVVNRINHMVKVVRELALIAQTSNFPSYLFALQLAIDVWGGFFISVSTHKHLKCNIILAIDPIT